MNNISVDFRGEPFHNVEHQDMVMAKRAADQLNKHYPGYMWAVNVNSEGGVMVIKNYTISFKYGMVLHLKNVNWDSQLISVMRAGGELIERANQHVGGYKGDQTMHVDGVMDRHQPKQGIII